MDLLKIKEPSEIKNLTVSELDKLCSDMRNFLINSISKTGGHLGSSLGVVELITAMHYEFNSPVDKLVFDIGHQAYVHKILTGRAGKFDTLRQYQGLSGFLKREESVHDVWEAGHSSNSISAAIGYAFKRDLDQEDNHVVCLIGDGSMTNGMALEALNHIIELKQKIIIVINDNEMSISHNVGFIDNILKNLDFNASYNKTKKTFRSSIDKLDKTHTITKGLRSVKNKIKSEINTSKGFFNLLGFKYYGPVDGHNIKDLIKAFKEAKNVNGPVVIHVKTIKGKGYLPAQEGMWHGINKFDIKTGQVVKSQGVNNSKVVSAYLQYLMSKDEDIIITTPAMIDGSALKEIDDKFPHRITDVGIAEEHATSFVAGLALAGKKPFLSIYSTFLQRSYDQLFQDIARQNCNVVVGIDRAGLVGEDGETHQGIYDISFLSHIPNLTITQGKDAFELKGLLDLAFKTQGPFCIRYSKLANNCIEDLEPKADKIEYGKWEILQLGKKVNIICYGEDVVDIYKLYKGSENIGIINARFIKPLDKEVLDKIDKSDIIVFEEHAKIGGLGSLVLGYYNSIDSRPKVKLISIEDNFVEQGAIQKLKEEQKISISNLKEEVMKYE